MIDTVMETLDKPDRNNHFAKNTSLLPKGNEKTHLVQEMFNGIASRYDLLNKIISLGLDSYWRKRTLEMLLLPLGYPETVLDLACGTGDFTKALAAKNIRAVGVDLSLQMLLNAKVDQANLLLCKGESLAIKDESIGAVVSGFALRNFTDQEQILKEIFRILIPGGRIALLDVGIPASKPLQLANNIWFRHIVPLIGNILSDKNAYAYLPKSVEYLPDQDSFQDLAREIGFSRVVHRNLSGGLVQVFLAVKNEGQTSRKLLYKSSGYKKVPTDR